MGARSTWCRAGYAAACLWAASAPAAEIAVSCGAIGREMALCREGAERWAAETGNTVRIVSTPNDASQRLALYQQLLAARSPDVDVFQIDVVWSGILGDFFADLTWRVPESVLDAHFEAAIENDRVAGRLVALPWFMDVGLLYYRQDLLDAHDLQVPETWADLAEAARRIQDAERAAGRQIWGYVFQGRAYEGLTCNALEWIASHGGGGIVDGDGTVSVDDPRAADALATVRSWIGEIAPPGVLTYAEEEARGVFQSGRAVFMRNWPYAWALAESPESPVAGRVGVTVLPRGPGGGHSGALGGAHLAVSRFSGNREAAIDLVLYLTSAEEQKRRAVVGAFNPTIRTLYDDPEILDANPFFATLGAAFEAAVSRPARATGVRYSRVSSAFRNTVHEILSGDAPVAPSLAALARRLETMRGDGWQR